jgi:dCMP deaminase
MKKWDLRFLAMAQLVGSWSKDPSTKCGCVIANGKVMISTGYNGYPVGVEDNLISVSDLREDKLIKTLHAEENAILYARQNLSECTLYVTPFQPCAHCSAVIIQSGIKEVVVGMVDGLDFARWEHSFKTGERMFNETGVYLRRIIL